MVTPGATMRRGPTSGMRVRKKRSRSRSAVGADRQTAGDPSGIGLPGRVPATYPPRPDP